MPNKESEPQVRTISHGAAQPVTDKPNVTRVAAYCRVSTLDEEQDNSFETQCEYYRRLIASDPAKQLVGIYGDHGASGLRIDGRVEFQRMMQDCREGKIDMVMTKSVSRFSRSLRDCSEAVGELRRLGISVVFEKEGIDTADPSSELFLNILASLAQEESNSLSQAIKWAMSRRAASGDPIRRACYGYRKEGKQWVIYEPEARFVRLAFDMAAQGHRCTGIARVLTESTGRKWSSQRVRYMLENEAYKGDLLTQKSYIDDYLSRKECVNHGEREQYYIDQHHTPIVTPEQFDEVKKGKDQ